MTTEHDSPAPTLALLGDDAIYRGDWNAWISDRVVHNFGAPDITSDDLLAHHEDILDVRPDAVAILIGTNDFSQRRSVEHVVRAVQLLLVTLRRELPGTRMLVQSILPREAQFAERISDANRHLRQFTPTLNAQFLDLWPALASPEGALAPEFTSGTTELNSHGYVAWVEELRPALERLDGAPPMTAPISIIRMNQS